MIRSSALLWLLAIASLSFLLLPLAALLLHVSYATAFHPLAATTARALGTSITATLLSMACILVFGTPLGWLLARRSGLVRNVIEWLLLIPLLLPPLVIGLLLVFFYGPHGSIGRWLADLGVSAINSLLAVVLAQIYEALPFYVFAAAAAFAQVDLDLERTSAALGVSPLRTFLRVTLPLAAPWLSVGFAMSFARAIGAFGAVIVIAYHPSTLPISIWVSLQEAGLPQALPQALLLLAVALPLPLLAVVWRGVRHARVAD